MPWLQCRQHWQFRPLKLMGKWLHPLVWYHINLIYTRWAYDVMITSLLCQNDVITSFWRNNDVIITSCVHWTCIYYFVHSILIKIITVSKRAPCCRKDETIATELKFLADISSSRSDAVCPSVHPSVCPSVCLSVWHKYHPRGTGVSRTVSDKYRLKRKEKNKSREEIFYQMKGFFV